MCRRLFLTKAAFKLAKNWLKKIWFLFRLWLFCAYFFRWIKICYGLEVVVNCVARRDLIYDNLRWILLSHYACSCIQLNSPFPPRFSESALLKTWDRTFWRKRRSGNDSNWTPSAPSESLTNSLTNHSFNNRKRTNSVYLTNLWFKH